MVGKGKGFMMHCSQVVSCTDNNKYVDTFTVFHCHFVEVPQFCLCTGEVRSNGKESQKCYIHVEMKLVIYLEK
jgi:hypothetical protein